MTRLRNVRNTTKFKRSIKAISPVIATLLMIAIAVVASLVVYAWVTGYMGSTIDKAGKAIQIQSFASLDGKLVIYVQNVGQGDVELNRDQSVYVDSTLIQLRSTMPAKIPIVAGQTVELLTDTPYAAGTKVNIKVTTTDGTFMKTTGTSSNNPTPGSTASPTPVPTASPTPTPVTITLRPNAAGTTTQLSAQGTGSANWDRVDEQTADGTTTYVRGNSDNAFQVDTYNIPDQTLSGTITNVVVWVNVRTDDAGDSGLSAYSVIRLGSGTWKTGTQHNSLTETWTLFSDSYATKPTELGGGAWTWANINSIEIGVGLRSQDQGWSGWDRAQCTQVWVEVTYTP